MISKILLRGTCAAVALCATSVPAYAQSSSTEILLQRLHEKGILTDEEYAELTNEMVAEKHAAPMEQAQSTLDSSRLVKMTDSGIGLEVGPATIKFSGSVNGFYVHDNPDTPSATMQKASTTHCLHPRAGQDAARTPQAA